MKQQPCVQKEQNRGGEGWSRGSKGAAPLEDIALCPGGTDGSGDTAPVLPSLATLPAVWPLTCSVSPKDSLWMTWVMSGFCGWAVALCVDTWKLPGTWGERQVSGVWWASPEGRVQDFALEPDRSGCGPQRGQATRPKGPLPASEPRLPHGQNAATMVAARGGR